EVDAAAGAHRLDPERHRQVAFAGAGLADQVHNLVAVDEVELGESQDAIAVERRLEGEVEARQRLDRAEAGHLQRRLDAAALADVGVNPDASLYCNAPGSDALDRHEQAAPNDWFGNAVPPSSACVAALAARSRRRSRLGRGRNSCRSQLGRDNPHKETVEPAARHGVRTRKRQVDERHDCQDNVPACVPSTVWGTASRRNSQVGVGAVLALNGAHANPPYAPRQPKTRAPKSQLNGRRPAFIETKLVQSALGSSPMSDGIHDDITRSAPNKCGFRQPLTSAAGRGRDSGCARATG